MATKKETHTTLGSIDKVLGDWGMTAQSAYRKKGFNRGFGGSFLVLRAHPLSIGCGVFQSCSWKTADSKLYAFADDFVTYKSVNRLQINFTYQHPSIEKAFDQGTLQ